MKETRRQVTQIGAGLGGLVGVAVLGGCAPGERAGQPASQSASKQPVTLRWSTWGNEANPMVDGAAKGGEIFWQKLPGAGLIPEAQVSTAGGPSWTEKNFAEWVAGTGPDVSGGCCATLPDW